MFSMELKEKYKSNFDNILRVLTQIWINFDKDCVNFVFDDKYVFIIDYRRKY